MKGRDIGSTELCCVSCGVQFTYEDCTACVKIDGNMSPWLGVNISVRQGHVLSARLFMVYFNSCLQRIKTMNVGLQIGDLIVNCIQQQMMPWCLQKIQLICKL
ncbi:unnamed protein product [Diatraea saccharalis]|uniref:Uncharacterized protein n=1 Tax=Diatraea saccharalis TaxID=40085 RepID=A0A9N9WHC7_9NEOP|nr:unnamed protein product [Diatraea saccharalis]